MDMQRLHDILSRVAVQLNKCEMTRRLADYSGEFELVDCHIVLVCIDKAQADCCRDEFIELLKQYPHPERLGKHPSYLEVGRVLESQEMAFELFALGQYLGLWKVITPLEMGVMGPVADDLARSGEIYIGDLQSQLVH